MLRPGEFALQPGGGHLQHILLGDGVLLIQHRGKGVGHVHAVVNGHAALLVDKHRRNQSAPSLTNCTSHRERFSSLARGSESYQTAGPHFLFSSARDSCASPFPGPGADFFSFILISKQKSGSPHSFIILPYTLLIIAPQSRKITTDDDHRGIVRRVPSFIPVSGIVYRHILQIVHPANDRPVIRMGIECRCPQCFVDQCIGLNRSVPASGVLP